MLKFARVLLGVALCSIGLPALGGAAPTAGDWSIVASPNTSATESNQLRGVACVSASDCWAVGQYFTGSAYRTLTERWNGSSWTIVPSPNASSTNTILYDVACTSASNCWAVGQNQDGAPFRTLIERWNGSSWAVVPSPNGGAQQDILHNVTCTSASNCWAVGYHYAYTNQAGLNIYETLVLRWNGTSWALAPSANTSATQTILDGVACVSASDCWAVGYSSGASPVGPFQTVIEHWNGATWAIVPSPSTLPAQHNYLFDVACASAASCWATGYSVQGATRRTLIERWNGTSWSIVPSPNTSATEDNALNGVTCVAVSDCWAVGYHGVQTLVERWDGTAWTIATSPSAGTGQNFLDNVTCVAGSDCWAVGYATGGSVMQTLIERHAGPTALQIRSFAAVRRQGRVTLRWSTGSDSRLAGFHVFRERGGSLVRRTRTTIASRAKVGGSSYAFEDTLPAGAKRARYRLQAVRLDGSRAFVGTAVAILR